MLRFKVFAICAASVVLAPWMVSAAPVTYTFTATVSGTVDGNSFTDALFTFVGNGDTSNITSCGVDCWSNDLTSATVTLAGFGSGSLTVSAFVFVNNDLSGVGDYINFDLLYVSDSALIGHDLATAFGPITGTASATGQGPFFTSFGVIDIQSILSDSGTFQTQINDVPEPVTVALTAAGLAGLAWRRRKQPCR
jgi:hypothetical protein